MQQSTRDGAAPRTPPTADHCCGCHHVGITTASSSSQVTSAYVLRTNTPNLSHTYGQDAHGLRVDECRRLPASGCTHSLPPGNPPGACRPSPPPLAFTRTRIALPSRGSCRQSAWRGSRAAVTRQPHHLAGSYTKLGCTYSIGACALACPRCISSQSCSRTTPARSHRP